MNWRKLLNTLGPFLGLLLVVGLFSLDAEVRGFFLSPANFKIIVTQTVVVAIAALGMTLIIVSGGIDLSVGSVIAFTGVLGALMIAAGWGAVAVVGATVLAGGLLGCLNGAIIGGLRMMPFIVTLGMLGVARGAAKWLAGNQTVNFPPSSVNNLMTPGETLPPPGVWIALALAVVMGGVMKLTVFGRHAFAIGSNETAARFSGVRVGWTKFAIYGVAGLFFGVAGLMQLARLRQGDPSVAVGVELDTIAAVVIGGASLSGGSGSVLGSLIGALIMAVLRNGSQQMGWPTYMQEIIIGLVIILAVGLDRWRQRSAN
jgi:ribose transport system permease protein